MILVKLLIVNLKIIYAFCFNITNSYSFTDESYHYVCSKFGSDGNLTVKQMHNYFKSLDLLQPLTEVLAQFYSEHSQNLTYVDSMLFSQISSNILADVQEQGYSFCHGNQENIESILSKPSLSSIWGFGFLSVTIISACSLVGISILPLMKSEIYDKLLLFLIALAVGTLSCNGIFQLIPEGFGIDSNPMTVWQSAVIFGGFYLFYLTENLLEKIFNTPHTHANKSFDNAPQSSSTSGERSSQNHFNAASIKWDTVVTDPGEEVLIQLPTANETPVSNGRSQSAEASLHPAAVTIVKQKQCWIFKNYKSIKTVAWLITVADGMHNFIDGLAIGASFSISMVQGVSTSLAIFCEEFPHELGDFAILVNSGMTIKQAAFYNFASACCCYIGLVVGILVGSDVSSAQWIFALAGGVFLYISLAGMLPEAQALCSKKSLKNSPWLCMVLKHAGLLSGFIIMLFLTVYKDDIKV